LPAPHHPTDRPTARRRTPIVTASLLALLALTGCATVDSAASLVVDASPSPSATAKDEAATGAEPGSARPTREASADGTPEAGTARAALADLTVKGRAPKTGYDRDEFGPAWADVDHNGCDTRNDILARDLTGETFKAGTHDCVVLTGTLDDPYTATQIPFQRGQSTSTAVQIDHVVALSDAWQKGAQQLSADERELLANDPLNLLAVDGPTNAAKGDGDAATWLPPHKAVRCAYVARQVAVKQTHELWVTQAEQDAMARVLDGCPDEPLPADADAIRVKPTATAAPPSEPAPSDEQTEAPADDAEAAVSYDNCTAVRDAGADPIRRGDPGYGRHLDRDGDGVACE
jgi:hypothetical protein